MNNKCKNCCYREDRDGEFNCLKREYDMPLCVNDIKCPDYFIDKDTKCKWERRHDKDNEKFYSRTDCREIVTSEDAMSYIVCPYCSRRIEISYKTEDSSIKEAENK